MRKRPAKYEETEDERRETRPRLTPYEYSLDFPPKYLSSDPVVAASWYRNVFEESAKLQEEQVLTQRETFLLTRSAEEYVTLRHSGAVTCEEYATVLVRRARHYRRMNQWIYSSYPLFEW